ncbi:MAG TPA: hypothetical protein PLH98_16580 [Ruminococcus flavefaciens]|nr:hypothetical protein [Ruminococcus flavefaciens]HQM02143.1 hypothetical protein [Ruminococcus flavefaciens]
MNRIFLQSLHAIVELLNIDSETFINQLRELRDAANKNDIDLAIKALHSIVPTFMTPDEFNGKPLVTV